MVEHLKKEGTSHSSRNRLKICVKIGTSCSAQTRKQEGGHTIRSWALLIFASERAGTHPSRGLLAQVGGGCWGKTFCAWGLWYWVLFKPLVKDIQVISQSGIFCRVGGWSQSKSLPYSAFVMYERSKLRRSSFISILKKTIRPYKKIAQ